MTSLRGTVRVSSPGAPPVRATAPGGGRVLVAPGVQGPPGHGVNLAGAVPTYADLPTLTVSDAGKAFMVQADGLLYVWSGVSWPADGAGAQFRGETGPEGRGIEVVSVDGDDLILGMSDGSTVRASVPALAAAVAARDVAVAARADAVSARGGAELARDGAVAAAGRAEGAAGGVAADAAAAVDAAGRAGVSAGAAADSATGAAGSAGAAALSESTAGAAATAAAGDAAAASGARDAAVAAADAAAGSATAAVAARGGAELARDEAVQAAESAQTSAPVEGWPRTSLSADVRDSLTRADTALTSVPRATTSTAGGVKLAGDLGGTWDAPTVPGLASKMDAQPVSDAATSSTLVKRTSGATIKTARPQADDDAATKKYVDDASASLTATIDQRATTAYVDSAVDADRTRLSALESSRATVAQMQARPAMWLWDGQGTWSPPTGAVTTDSVLNLATGEIHSIKEAR